MDDDAATGAPSTSTGASGSTSSSSGAGGSTGTEPGAQMGMTAAHNQVRAAVQSPEPVPPLQWSPAIAEVAQAYAEQLGAAGCPLEHSGGSYGENLFWGSGNYSAAEVVGAWAEEISCFTNTTFPDACGCLCGHYTQIVWRDSAQLGCGVGACPGGGEIWVCNYDPPGNFIGQMTY